MSAENTSLTPKYRVISNETGQELAPDTFFVIKETDVFSAQALWGYGHLLQSAIELNSLPFRAFLSEEEKLYLESIIERLGTLAESWRFRPKQIPT